MSAALTPVQALACELIARESVTPDDAGCQALLAARLKHLGFDCRTLTFGDVTNLWAVRPGAGATLAFAGHTDVVPTGPLAQWSSAPFTPTVRDGVVYGRGAADMKGSLAAMVGAFEELFAQGLEPGGRLAVLVTSDEEGVAVDGTARVVEWLREHGEVIDWCVVGEPSSRERLGDVVRNGRRGSLSGRLTVLGRQGHIAYPQSTDNPIHRLSRAIAALADEVWDDGNEYFPPTSFQVSNTAAGTGADNVVPGEASALFNFRFSSASTAAVLEARAGEIVARHAPHHRLDWRVSGEPFLTPRGTLTSAVAEVLTRHVGAAPEFSTGGGTSDGRFIARLGTQVVELGPINASIHQIDEHVRLEDLDRLAAIYRDLILELLPPAA